MSPRLKITIVAAALALGVAAFGFARRRGWGERAMVVAPAQLRLTELAEGRGPAAHEGSRVIVHYVLRSSLGRVVADTHAGGNAQAANFVIGQHQVLAGLEQGVIGMREGGSRKIVVPPELAYGRRGAPPIVAPNSEIEYEVQLLRAGEDESPLSVPLNSSPPGTK